MSRQFGARDNGVPNLAVNVRKSIRRMRDQDRVGMVVRGYFLESVEVLGHQDELHHVLGSGTRNGFREILDRIFQSSNDRFSLIRDAFSLQAF